MKTTPINEICDRMRAHLTEEQNRLLRENLQNVFLQFNIPDTSYSLTDQSQQTNMKLLTLFIAAKKIEGCSEKTLKYYSSTLLNMLDSVQKNVCEIETDDIRFYLCRYQDMRNSSKVTLDNIRRIMSDENLERLRDTCRHTRDLAIIDLLISTGIRVGELVNLNQPDINFNSRECIVLGKGDKERRVYFDAKTKIHLQQYLSERSDSNCALFVGLRSPWNRLSIAGVERFLAKLGDASHVHHVHPHKFRRTMATMAIEKGMPIEQLQKLLGHTQIDTTLHYAIVNEKNVKLSHQKYVC